MTRLSTDGRRGSPARRSKLAGGVGGLLAFAVLAGACGSSGPEEPPEFKNPPVRDTKDASGTDASDTGAPDGGTASDSDTTNQVTKWRGSLSASPTVQFGGKDGFCLYNVAMKDVQVDLYMDNAGNGIDGTVTSVMEEQTVGTCSFKPLGSIPHTYTMRESTSDGSTLRVEFDRAPDNEPKATLVFEGTFNDSELNGTLTWRRFDALEQFNWTIDATLRLLPSP